MGRGIIFTDFLKGNIFMKKLWTILILCVVAVFCAFGFAACELKQRTDDDAQQQEQAQNEPSGQSQDKVSMTKDDFLAELVKRETATFANADLHYATVDCKLVISEGDPDSDGTYDNQTCDIFYGTNQYSGNFAYISIKIGENGNRGQQQRLFCADYLTAVFGYVPAEMLSEFTFEKDGDNLKLLCDTEYNGGKVYMEYVFDANGYLTYRKEVQGDGTNGESIEFTAKAYNRTKDLEVDAFLTTLRELEHLSYSDVRYVSVSGTSVEQVGTNPQTTETRDYTLTYRLDGDDNEVAQTEESGLTVLGLSWLMDEYKDAIDNDTNSTCTVKKVGSCYDVTAEFDADDSHLSVHYVFDKDGYVVYIFEQEGDEYMVEFTATAYNKTSGDGTVEYTVNAEQWDKGVTLYWTNVTYEYTAAGYGTQKVELLEDGGLHQYAMDGGGGEVYVIYSNGTWKVYQGEGTTPDFTYDTEDGYIENNYGDDIGFMKNILLSLRGKSDLFTFNGTTNKYFAANVEVPYGSGSYPLDVTAEFENQKLVHILFESDGITVFEATFTDYGTTVIDYPDYVLNA